MFLSSDEFKNQTYWSCTLFNLLKTGDYCDITDPLAHTSKHFLKKLVILKHLLQKILGSSAFHMHSGVFSILKTLSTA